MSTFPMTKVEQQMAALAIANERRMFRAQLKRDVKAGVVDPVQVLLHPPDLADTMTVREFLGSIRQMGPLAVNRALVKAGVSQTMKLGGLTGRQRTHLALILQARREAA